MTSAIVSCNWPLNWYLLKFYFVCANVDSTTSKQWKTFSGRIHFEDIKSFACQQKIKTQLQNTIPLVFKNEAINNYDYNIESKQCKWRHLWNVQLKKEQRAPYITEIHIGEQKRHSSRGLHSFIQYVECCNGVVKPWWRHVIAGSLRRSLVEIKTMD